MPETERKAIEMTDRVRVPDHVVYRSFAAETVVLNLETGRYHGLNGSAGVMFETLDRGGTLEDAAVALADELEVPRERLDADLQDLCARLAERGLVEVVVDGFHGD
jgi:Coenzyme PQQ synthesis protein D (PqqD)